LLRASGGFGVTVECACGIFRRRRQAAWDVQLGYPLRLERRRFADLQALGLPEARNAAEQYAAAPAGWLYLFGGYGTGKTTLAACATNALRSSGCLVAFGTAPSVFDWLKSTFDRSDDGPTFAEAFDRLCAVPILVLDDLHQLGRSTWAREHLFRLIDHRYASALPLIVTSTVPPDREPDPAISSRFRDVMLVRAVHCGSRDVRTTERW
jgi:DNA replication protein DnaC